MSQERVSWEEGERRVALVHEALVERAIVAPLAFGGGEESMWLDFELASLAENRLGDLTGPHGIDDDRRASWLARATTERPSMAAARGGIETCYWLLDGGEHVGTIALATSRMGGNDLRVTSLYVLPSHRGRGIAGRALREAGEALGVHGMGLRLSTNWTWQSAVRFYLRRGMWLRMWKRDLEFRWRAGEPSPRAEIAGDRANLCIDLDGRRQVVASARRDGDLLVLDEVTEPDDKRVREIAWDARSTLSLHLALHGWPLIRSAEAWERSRGSDCYAPEALAYKIMIWEAWDRKHGFRVQTRRIAGLEYPAWDELDVGWK
jgi:GNAT superfamily N-acetyltransferase